MAFINLLKKKELLIVALRISLGLIFLWFGLLKAFGYNPVFDLVNGVHPLLATPVGNTVLGVIEALIGLLLLTNIYPFATHLVLIVHLIGTFLTFVTAPELMFDPHFPILSLNGEFVFKNIALATAGLVVLAHASNKRA
jgi:putative oxidoreductase